MNHTHRIFLAAVLLTASLVAASALADNAAVISFIANPGSARSGEPVSLSWSTANSGGAVLLLPCAPGIRYKDSRGQPIACDTKTSYLVNDSAVIMFANSYGSAIYARPALIPKNANGAENAAAKREIQIAIAPDSNPIREVTGTTTAASGASFTLTWSAPDLEKVNVRFNCVEGVAVTVSGDARPSVPCDANIFSADLPPQGSRAFAVTNTTHDHKFVVFRFFPKITSTADYDGTHARAFEIEIGPAPETRNPAVKMFSLGAVKLKSGEKLKAAWDVAGAAGVNLRLSCADGVTATSSLTGTSTLPCGENVFLFSLNLPLESSLTLGFLNSAGRDRAMALTLVPALGGGSEYDGTKIVSKTFTVAGKYASVSQPPPLAPPSVLASSTAATSAILSITKELFYGLKNEPQVSVLQKILKADGLFSLAPTGNFFSATLGAVKQFQARYGIRQTGYVGPLTIKKLNEVAKVKGAR